MFLLEYKTLILIAYVYERPNGAKTCDHIQNHLSSDGALAGE